MPLKTENEVETIVRDFYENYGWVQEGEKSGEDKSFREFLPFHQEFYSIVTAQRELAQCDGLTGHILLAGGGDIPSNHIAITQQFAKVTCVDFSQRALDISKEKLGPKADCVNASILAMPLPDNSVDAVFCAHVIYHIHGAQQAAAVRQLIRVTRPGGRVVITYSNPRSPQNTYDRLMGYAKWPWRRLRRAMERANTKESEDRPPLYQKTFPLSFWKQFRDDCDVKLLPWQVFTASQEQKYVRTNEKAEKFYRWAARLEEKNPKIAVRLWSYPLIVLTKK